MVLYKFRNLWYALCSLYMCVWMYIFLFLSHRTKAYTSYLHLTLPFLSFFLFLVSIKLFFLWDVMCENHFVSECLYSFSIEIWCSFVLLKITLVLWVVKVMKCLKNKLYLEVFHKWRPIFGWGVLKIFLFAWCYLWMASYGRTNC